MSVSEQWKPGDQCWVNPGARRIIIDDEREASRCNASPNVHRTEAEALAAWYSTLEPGDEVWQVSVPVRWPTTARVLDPDSPGLPLKRGEVRVMVDGGEVPMRVEPIAGIVERYGVPARLYLTEQEARAAVGDREPRWKVGDYVEYEGSFPERRCYGEIVGVTDGGRYVVEESDGCRGWGIDGSDLRPWTPRDGDRTWFWFLGKLRESKLGAGDIASGDTGYPTRPAAERALRGGDGVIGDKPSSGSGAEGVPQGTSRQPEAGGTGQAALAPSPLHHGASLAATTESNFNSPAWAICRHGDCYRRAQADGFCFGHAKGGDAKCRAVETREVTEEE